MNAIPLSLIVIPAALAGSVTSTEASSAAAVIMTAIVRFDLFNRSRTSHPDILPAKMQHRGDQCCFLFSANNIGRNHNCQMHYKCKIARFQHQSDIFVIFIL
jgi:hypothetical protein